MLLYPYWAEVLVKVFSLQKAHFVKQLCSWCHLSMFSDITVCISMQNECFHQRKKYRPIQFLNSKREIKSDYDPSPQSYLLLVETPIHSIGYAFRWLFIALYCLITIFTCCKHFSNITLRWHHLKSHFKGMPFCSRLVESFKSAFSRYIANQAPSNKANWNYWEARFTGW